MAFSSASCDGQASKARTSPSVAKIMSAQQPYPLTKTPAPSKHTFSAAWVSQTPASTACASSRASSYRARARYRCYRDDDVGWCG
jgi:hypothetical protein